MFQKRNVVCAVEIGTSKICVLVGEVDCKGGISAVLGQGSVASAGVVVKGEIVDMEKCAHLLNKALEAADRTSNGEVANCRLLTVLVTGGGIDSTQGLGIATVKSGMVSEEDRIEAETSAKLIDIYKKRLDFS